MTGVSAISGMSAIVIGLVGVITFTVGGQAIVAGEMTLGGLFRYVAFTAYLTMPVVQLAAIGAQVTEAVAGGDLRGEVACERVWFEYNPGVPVLKDVSFVAPAGSTTALVGSSGSGKSTIISLIMAFNRPLQGRGLVDGRDLASLKQRDYRSY